MQEIADRLDLVRGLIGRNPFPGQAGDVFRGPRTDLAVHDDAADSTAARTDASEGDAALDMDREGSILLVGRDHGNVAAPSLSGGALRRLDIPEFDERILIVGKRVRRDVGRLDARSAGGNDRDRLGKVCGIATVHFLGDRSGGHFDFDLVANLEGCDIRGSGPDIAGAVVRQVDIAFRQVAARHADHLGVEDTEIGQFLRSARSKRIAGLEDIRELEVQHDRNEETLFHYKRLLQIPVLAAEDDRAGAVRLAVSPEDDTEDVGVAVAGSGVKTDPVDRVAAGVDCGKGPGNVGTD